MRAESAGPRTWMLAALAGWAMLALLMAVAGMGGRIEPLAMQADLLEPLPATRAADSPSLAPLAQFSEIGSRPLFSNDRKPKPFSLQGESEQTGDSAFDYQLTSVLITPGLKMAILQPADGSRSVRVKLDAAPESHPAWRLVELDARAAVFDGPEGRRTLTLRVFDGQGGQAPTPLAAGAAGERRGAAPPPPATPATPREMAAPSPPATADVGTEGPKTGETASAPAATPESQMEAIRQRIQARRAALREQAQNRQNPPSQPTPPKPPSSPSPNPPEQSR